MVSDYDYWTVWIVCPRYDDNFYRIDHLPNNYIIFKTTNELHTFLCLLQLADNNTFNIQSIKSESIFFQSTSIYFLQCLNLSMIFTLHPNYMYIPIVPIEDIYYKKIIGATA